MIVYVTTNLVDGKKYIGKAVRRDRTYLGSGLLIQRAINKHGKDNFIKEILAEAKDKADLDELETYYIDYYGAVKSDLFYNLAKGGTGGKTWPDEKCQRCQPVVEIFPKTRTTGEKFEYTYMKNNNVYQDRTALWKAEFGQYSKSNFFYILPKLMESGLIQIRKSPTICNWK